MGPSKPTLITQDPTDYTTINSSTEAFTESLNLNLIHVASRYLVTDVNRLLSPAGFHTSDRVFVASRISLHIDNLKDAPSSNVELFAFDIDHAVKEDNL